MVSGSESLAPDYFERVYAADPDPWKFETSDYERAKYARSMAALEGSRHARGFEIGCSIGVLTEQLAAHCSELLAVDVSEQALARARQRCARLAQVRFAAMPVPEQVPDGSFDLVVASEVGYYWSLADLHRAADWMLGAARPAATLLLVHWTAPVHDYPLTGDTVHEQIGQRAQAAGFVNTRSEREPEYRLDVWRRSLGDAGDPQVAASPGANKPTR